MMLVVMRMNGLKDESADADVVTVGLRMVRELRMHHLKKLKDRRKQKNVRKSKVNKFEGESQY